MMFHIYHADCIGDPSNCSYPMRMRSRTRHRGAAIQRDYVCAEHQNHYRSNENFIGNDFLPRLRQRPYGESEGWIYPSDVAQAFPNVALPSITLATTEEQEWQSAGPKFHVFFHRR